MMQLITIHYTRWIIIGAIYYVRWTIYKIWEKIKKPTDFIKIGRFLWFIEELVWDTAIYYLEEENEAPHKLILGGSKSSVFGGWKAEGDNDLWEE
jgi:hypothetical protein